MPTIRMNREQMQGGYTVLPNQILRTREMSYKARYLLAQMLSMSEAWQYTVAGMAKVCGMGRDAVRTAMVELETPGLLSAQSEPRQWALLPQRVHHPRSTDGGGSCPFGSRTPGAAQRRRPRNARRFHRSFLRPGILFCTVGGFSAAGFHAAGKPAAKKEQG